MGTASSLPEEVLITNVAEFSFRKKEDFLSLRATCKLGADLARRTLTKGRYPRSHRHNSCHMPDNISRFAGPREIARYVEATGRVFGAATQYLFSDASDPVVVAALESYIGSTSSLCSLHLSNSMIPVEVLLRICSMVPRLASLEGPRNVAITDDAIRAIGMACPKLCAVKFSLLGRESAAYSPAETWARHFPQLRALQCRGRKTKNYRPTRLDAIRETALVSQATELDVEGCHVTTDLIAALVGTPLADRIKTIGDRYMRTTNIEPDAMLAAARGFPNLAELWIPEGSVMGGPGFYVDLSRATNLTRLTSLNICDVETSDECVATACEHLQLHELELVGLGRLTSSGIVNGITRSRSAKTLGYLVISCSAQGPDSPLRAVDVLRIFQGCPELGVFNWYCDEGNRQYAALDDEPVKAIIELMKSRGSPPCYYPGNPSPDTEIYTIFEV